MDRTLAPSAVRARLAAAAPLLFVLLWSTGFIGARLGLPLAEPFTLLGLRFAVAALLLAGIAAALRAPWPATWAQVGHSGVVGLLLHGGYLGGVFFAIDHGMPAGLAALIVSLQPILTAVVSQLGLREHVSARAWLGLVLGLAGVALVVGEKLLGPGAGVALGGASLLAAVVALVATTAGTLYQKRFGTGVALLGGTCVQYLAAAALMLPLAFGFETRRLDWTPELLFALGWLVLVLSLGAVLLLMTLIRQRSAARVASLFYLVPPATAVEAYLIFGEGFGALAFAGLALASLGVALVVTGQ